MAKVRGRYSLRGGIGHALAWPGGGPEVWQSRNLLANWVVAPGVRRRTLKLVILGVPAATLIAGASIAVYNRIYFGTFYTAGAPPRISYCGRTYYPGDTARADSLAHLTSFLASSGQGGLTRIGSTPSGLPIVANLMSPETRASFHTDVCTMEVWVQTGPDSYVVYGLSGGP